MAGQTMSMRISEEVQELFKSATQASGLKQEEFLVALLTSYSRHAESEEITSMTQEKAQVRAGLERVRILVEAVIDRAGDESRQAHEEIRVKSDAFNARLDDLQEEIKRKGEAINLLSSENSRLKENQESRSMLKQAFDEKLASANQQIESLKGRIEDLEKVVEDKDRLEKKVAECENTMRGMELDHQKEINKIMEAEKEKLQAFVLEYSKMQGEKK
jgi:chromosome segregation ATPase